MEGNDNCEEESDFVRWQRAQGCSKSKLGRPLSRVVVMTAGLEKLMCSIRGGRASSTCNVSGHIFDDQSGFLVLPDERSAEPVVLGGRYRLIRLIGSGTFAQTMEAEDDLSPQVPRTRVAIKIIRSGLKGIAEREAELLHLLKHSPGFLSANIVQAFSAFRMLDHDCIVMELLAQPLPHFLRSVRPFSLPMCVMQKLSVQLVIALAFLQANGVIHADIRPENVLVCLDRAADSGGLKVKLADFGNGMLEGQAALECENGEVQTLPYRAPEVLLGLPITAKIDMWSLGCLLLEVYMGRRLLNPYNTTSALSTMTRTLVRSLHHHICDHRHTWLRYVYAHGH
jgi:serine/threonine protein kinase